MEAFSMFLFCFTIFPFYALAADTMLVNQTIRDGQTIVSPNQTFELGFFSPGNASENRYIGIWFKRLATGTITWVANRETPIRNNSGELTLNSDGVLVLRDSTTNRVIWSSNTKGKTRNPVARLLDTGNFMIIGDDADGPDEYIWQSFDYMGDTQLPGMKCGRNLDKGIVTNFTSWKSVDDPSPGPFMIYMDFNGLPQVYEKKGDVILSRLGSWNGLAFTGRPRVIHNNSIYKIEFFWTEREVYSKYELINPNILVKLVLGPGGSINRFGWINRTQGWSLLSSPLSDDCDRYALCGPYGSCEIEQSPPCGCFKGFTPKSPGKWDLADWNDGCQRVIPLDCSPGEGFKKYSFLKLPDTNQSWFDKNMTIEQCEKKCKSECNCTAYTTLDIKYGFGCLLWTNELIDMRKFPGDGQDIYIRMAAAELDEDRKVSRSRKKIWIIVIPVIVGLAILFGLVLLIIRNRKHKAQGRYDANKKVLDLPMLSLSILLTATNNFSDKNKIGQGGFGSVYKGYLEDGREVAVKRLSESSTQGFEEFKNEVTFISKLQHRNLVKILGWCIEGEEKLLIYEYMPNKSLDLHIPQDDNQKLNWSQRFHILNGIARGLLYLHQDSRLRIIHRDLKAANILLDEDMNAKISDFGIARSFKENETLTNTKQVVGTYGYISPEYARDGVISVKSDIFSFGVIVLEIVSGKKNRGFCHEDHSHSLLGHAWKLYKEGKTLELVDAYTVESSHKLEVLRSIQVGLLCVQHNPDDRPEMSEVVMMLSGKGQLTEPKQPGFYQEDSSTLSINNETQCSNNNLTVTLLEAR